MGGLARLQSRACSLRTLVVSQSPPEPERRQTLRLLKQRYQRVEELGSLLSFSHVGLR